MKAKRYAVRPVNRIFATGLALVLILFAGISCYYAYVYETDAYVQKCELALRDVYEAYRKRVYSFMQVYEPAFGEERSESLMRAYFSRVGPDALDVQSRGRLVSLLGAMVNQDMDIDWIALYNPAADTNYYLARGGSQLMPLPGGFPYYGDDGGAKFALLGAAPWTDAGGVSRRAYVIKGGAIPASQAGSIFVGYSLAPLQKIAERAAVDAATAFLLLADGRVAFDSSGEWYGGAHAVSWLGAEKGVYRDESGKRWYAATIQDEGRPFAAAYIIPWGDLFLRGNVNTLRILAILVFFALFAQGLYALSSRRIARRVSQIRSGLSELGQNRLDYRLAISHSRDEFDEISEYINAMAALLQTTVEKEYEMRIQQLHLQLTQIQARFNPHFLYNTLEMIRGRLYEGGDRETADYIEKLSRIFRNLTDARSVVKIRDEIAFCSLYVALLQLRFDNAVDVACDIDPQVQPCGILANLIQPAIENFFVHGLDEAADSHELRISCVLDRAGDIRIQVADNGMGVPPGRLEEVNARLAAPGTAGGGFGLMSIATRIRLFYGEGYGVRMDRNEGGGTSVTMRIPRMSVEAHERKLTLRK